MSDSAEPEEEDKDRSQVTVVIGIVLCLILGLGTSHIDPRPNIYNITLQEGQVRSVRGVDVSRSYQGASLSSFQSHWRTLSTPHSPGTDCWPTLRVPTPT